MTAPDLPCVCDGCGKTVSQNHVSDRIARLEMATRFRPIHIQVLLLAASPEATGSSFFYSLEETSEPSEERLLLQSILAACAVDTQGKTQESCLLELQRLGIFLAYVAECPGQTPKDVHRQVALRVKFSYRPKCLAALDSESHAVLGSLAAGGLGGARLIPGGDGDWRPSVLAGEERVRFTLSLRSRLQGCTG